MSCVFLRFSVKSNDISRPDTSRTPRKHPTTPDLSKRQNDQSNKVGLPQGPSEHHLSAVSAQYQPYQEMLDSRRREAKRSILVEVEKVSDSRGLKSFCERLGPLNKCFVYRSSGKVTGNLFWLYLLHIICMLCYGLPNLKYFPCFRTLCL